VAKPAVTIGTLRHRITIQRRSVSSDDHASTVETFTDLCTVWSAINYPLTGSGEAQANAIHLATTAAIFRIRNRSLEFTDRIVYDSANWDILRIAPDEKREYLDITAERRK
jgi:head-tail adaptor